MVLVGAGSAAATGSAVIRANRSIKFELEERAFNQRREHGMCTGLSRLAQLSPPPSYELLRHSSSLP